MTLLYGKDSNGNQVPLLVDASGVVQTTGGGTTWPGTSSQLTAGDGTAVTVGSGLSLAGATLTAPGGWQTTYEVDFTTLTPVASYSNGTATIDGKTWTFASLSANALASLSVADGLKLTANSGTTSYPQMDVNLSSFSAMPGRDGILIWARLTPTISTSGGTESNANMSVTYAGGSSTTIVPRFRLGWLPSGSAGAPSGKSWNAFGLMANTLYPSSGNELSSYTTTNTSHDVWVIRVVSANIAEIYTGTWSAGWPAFSSLQFRNYFMINAIAPPGAASSPFGNPNDATLQFYVGAAGATSANTVAKLLNLRVQVK